MTLFCYCWLLWYFQVNVRKIISQGPFQAREICVLIRKCEKSLSCGQHFLYLLSWQNTLWLKCAWKMKIKNLILPKIRIKPNSWIPLFARGIFNSKFWWVIKSMSRVLSINLWWPNGLWLSVKVVLLILGWQILYYYYFELD